MIIRDYYTNPEYHVILEKQELQDNKCQQQYKYTDKQTKLNIIYYNQQCCLTQLSHKVCQCTILQIGL